MAKSPADAIPRPSSNRPRIPLAARHGGGYHGRMTAMPGTIEKRGGVSPRDFYRDYMQPRRPVVLTDALAGWPALGKWTPEFFAARWPDKTFDLDGKNWRLADFIAAV